MTLQTIVPGKIWHAQQPIKFGPLSITTRSTFVKLDDGSLWVHSPIAPTQALLEEVNRIGPVRYVVAPNKSHHLFFTSFIDNYPEAKGYLAPGLAKKGPDLARYEELNDSSSQAWRPELVGYFVDGIPALNETVWFHPETGTLIVTDLLCCFGNHHKGTIRLLARLLGVQAQMRMSRTMKLLAKDKTALARVAQQLLTLDVHRVVLAHDQIVDGAVKAELEAAFSWLMQYIPISNTA